MPVNAHQLGLEGTVTELRRIMVNRFQLAKSLDSISADEPLFSAGVGLSSLEGAELLSTVERHFDVQFRNVEHWFDDPPTLGSFAQHLVDKS